MPAKPNMTARLSLQRFFITEVGISKGMWPEKLVSASAPKFIMNRQIKCVGSAHAAGLLGSCSVQVEGLVLEQAGIAGKMPHNALGACMY